MNKYYLKEESFGVLILAYRQSLKLRYSKENLSRFKEFESIDSGTVSKLINYFLELLYPEIEKRRELDKAFCSLESFIHSPGKLFGLLGSVGTIIFKFGKQFFSAAQAGVSALKSYVKANQFEAILYENALKKINSGEDIFLEKNFNGLIAKIPKPEADEFRSQIVSLFKTLSDIKLLAKVEEVLLYVISKMKEKSTIYDENDLLGIELGLIIIIAGKDLFSDLDAKQVAIILKGIDSIEADFYLRCL
jgi:hypothetical protein